MFSSSFGLANAIGPSLGGFLTEYWGWRWVFFFTGSLGLAWTVWWAWSYFTPAEHPPLTAAQRSSFGLVLEPTAAPPRRP